MPMRYESSLAANTDTLPSGGALAAGGVFIAAIPAPQREHSVGETIALTLQRSVEGLIAAIALIATSPILLVIGAIVRLDSPGPVLFRQLRIGANGRLFW